MAAAKDTSPQLDDLVGEAEVAAAKGNLTTPKGKCNRIENKIREHNKRQINNMGRAEDSKG